MTEGGCASEVLHICERWLELAQKQNLLTEAAVSAVANRGQRIDTRVTATLFAYIAGSQEQRQQSRGCTVVLVVDTTVGPTTLTRVSMFSIFNPGGRTH
jgi:hypothetical protein